MAHDALARQNKTLNMSKTQTLSTPNALGMQLQTLTDPHRVRVVTDLSSQYCLGLGVSAPYNA